MNWPITSYERTVQPTSEWGRTGQLDAPHARCVDGSLWLRSGGLSLRSYVLFEASGDGPAAGRSVEVEAA